jgi:NADP-dependent 3-hydroxy acid dehydrogenase YdfG
MNVHSKTSQAEPCTMSKTPKLILITGATAGIGRTTALYLARQGHHVIATGRRAAELAALATEVAADAAVATAGGKLDTVALDVTSPASIDAAVREVGRICDARGPAHEIGRAHL